MTLRVLVVPAAVALLLVAGCGRESAVSPATSESPSSPPTASPSPSSPGSVGSPSPSLPRLTPKVPSMPPITPPEDNLSATIPIDSASASADQRTLKLAYTLATPCTPGLDHAEAKQSADAVVVTLHRKPKPPGPEPICAQVIVNKTTTVELTAPLGKRPVVDGSSGKTIKLD